MGAISPKYAEYISNVRRQAESVKSQFLDIVGEVVLENKDKITPFVVQQQYDAGMGGTQPLKPYSRKYKTYKQKLGLYQGYTDFRLTGDMHNNMDIMVADGQYTITSNVEYINDLIIRDGDQSFELNPENIAAVQELLQEPIQQRISELIPFD